MSTETIDEEPLTPVIKVENDSDEDWTHGKAHVSPHEQEHRSDLSTAVAGGSQASTPAYKGKMEVTSKGRRKIFDGVRWQILCRRPGVNI